MNGITISGGILNLYKPSGITSHTAVGKVRRIFNTKKVGHTGTLDPMATGVLPILVGSAVKASEYMTESHKAYRATLRLGLTTDTQDITGNILSTNTDLPSAEKVIETAKAFVGEYMQTPPMYSAIKKDGKKLYELARAGVEVERDARPVQIISLDISPLENGDYSLTVHCSKGTYIRTLLHDIGQSLGCGGTMTALERISCCGFDVSCSVSFEDLENCQDPLQYLLPVEDYFKSLPALTLEDFFARLAHNGAQIYLHKLKDVPPLCLGERARLYDKDGFFALGEVSEYPEGIAVKPIKFFI